MGPTVIVHSPKIQSFLGVRYHLRGKYFQRDKKIIHRVVWEHFNGPIPTGHVVHHVDGDRNNNQPGNLVALTEREHMQGHLKGKYKPWPRAAIEASIRARRTDSARTRARENYYKMADVLHQRVEVVCAQCHKTFIGAPKWSKYCSARCSAAFRRASLVDHVERACAWCGKKFLVVPWEKQQTCSHACGQRMRRTREKG